LTVSSLYSIAVTRSQFNRVWDVWWNGKFASWMFSQQIYSNCEKISEECFQHLVESMPWRIKAVLKAKVGHKTTCIWCKNYSPEHQRWIYIKM